MMSFTVGKSQGEKVFTKYYPSLELIKRKDFTERMKQYYNNQLKRYEFHFKEINKIEPFF